MRQNTLKDRMEQYRNLVDYKLAPNSYVIAMVDGHSFSKMVKKRYTLPFDEKFIDLMNKTAKYVCEHLQGCKLAYTQSDEISFLITDFDTPNTDAWFGYRLCKMQSLIASYATAEFNRLRMVEIANTPCSASDMGEMIASYTPVVFDCKCWTVPTYNDAFAWFLYRQNDCVRNSKQQAAQTYLSSKSLNNLTTDKQIEKLKEEKGIDWHQYTNGEKYGRILYKENITMTVKNHATGEDVMTERSKWVIKEATPFSEEGHKVRRIIPKRDYLADVYVVNSTYNNGKQEVNAVYRDENGAIKMKEFIEKSGKEVFVGELKECNINHMAIL